MEIALVGGKDNYLTFVESPTHVATATRSQHSYILKNYALISRTQVRHECRTNALGDMYSLSIAQALNLAVRLFQLFDSQNISYS